MAVNDILAEISREVPKQCESTDGFIFTAFQCAVFEKELDDGRFEYFAVNLKSSAKLTLERRRIPVTGVTIRRLVRKLRDSNISGPGRFEITEGLPPMSASRLKDVMNDVFRKILPEYGYVVREGQLAMAEKMLDAALGRNVLVAEAAVGLGKTLVYIIVGTIIKRSGINKTWNAGYFPNMSVVEWQRMPILISTSSIALQKSVLTYIDEVSEILIENGVMKTSLSAYLKKGRMNYICEHNLRAYLPYEKNPHMLSALVRLCDGEDIDLAEIRDLTPYVKSKIRVPIKCYRNCPYAAGCSFIAFRQETQSASYDFIVTNHNLLIMDAKLRAENKRGILPPVQLYVLDEAHQLESAARSIYGLELSAKVIPDIAGKLLAMNFKPVNYLQHWREVRIAVVILANQLISLNAKLFSGHGADFICNDTLHKIIATSDYLGKVLRGSPELMVKRDMHIKHMLVQELERLSGIVYGFSAAEEQLLWFEHNKKVPGDITLHGQPKHLGNRLYDELWSRGVPALLTSGTLSVADDFTAFKQTVGADKISRLSETSQISPYDYRNNCLLYLSGKVPYPKHSCMDYIDMLSAEIERLILATHGHCAVLFTSYSVMGRVFSKLQNSALPYSLFKLERRSSNAIEQFKRSGNGVLFASGALWEGIDIPGDTLSLLIIAKLPFETPDRVSEYEQSLHPNFYDYLDKVLTPKMLVKLKQGFGRLLRTTTDTGVVAILDIRAHYGGTYHERVIQALPNCHVTESIEDVSAFIQIVKTSEYFE